MFGPDRKSEENCPMEISAMCTLHQSILFSCLYAFVSDATADF
jgi:hypothetical protein